MKERPRIFVSYSERDRVAVDRILRRLSDDLKARPGREIVFWDQSQITPGENWAAEVSQALEQASAMLVFISPAYLASQWSRRELDFALSSPRYEGRLVPVLLKASSDLPWILQRLSLIDATKDADAATHQIAKALIQAEVVRS